jgi:hypothetical protein
MSSKNNSVTEERAFTVRISSQSGIASLLVTMVLMIVISLIVLGFAQVSRREQQNTLDRQLSSQAFYAAESGVNDAEAAISTALKAGTTVPPKTDCTKPSLPGDIYSTLDYNVNASQGVKYTCLLVSTQVSDLHKTLGVDQEWVTPVYPVATDGTPKAVTNLKFTWPPDTAGQTSLAQCPTNTSGFITNPTLANWGTCAYGAVRIDLVPVPNNGSTISRASLTSSDMVVFAYPSGGGGTFTYGAGTSGGSTHQAFAKCNGSGTSTCVLNIGGLTAPAGSTYYARVHMLYKGTSSNGVLKINATDVAGTDDTSTLFSGAQAQIDSTGKAQDVLRRIRVTVNLTSNPQYSPYGLETRDSICKRYTIAPGIAPNFQVPAGMTDSTNPMCSTSATGGGGAACVAGTTFDYKFPNVDITNPNDPARLGDLSPAGFYNGPFPLNFTLKPGTYKVTLYSYDIHHSVGPPNTSPGEQWKAQLFDSLGNIIYTSPVSTDIPTSSLGNNTSFGGQAIPGGAVTLRAAHAYNPSNAPGGFENSFEATEAVFLCQ